MTPLSPELGRHLAVVVGASLLLAGAGVAAPGLSTQHAVLSPRWDVRPLVGVPVPVEFHIDPSSTRLVAISTPHGIPWCMPIGRGTRQQGL